MTTTTKYINRKVIFDLIEQYKKELAKFQRSIDDHEQRNNYDPSYYMVAGNSGMMAWVIKDLETIYDYGDTPVNLEAAGKAVPAYKVEAKKK